MSTNRKLAKETQWSSCYPWPCPSWCHHLTLSLHICQNQEASSGWPSFTKLQETAVSFSVNIFLCAPGSSSGYCLAFGHSADAQCLQHHCFIRFAQVLIYFMQRVCLMLISPSQLEAKSKFFQSYFIIVIAILRQCFAVTPDWPWTCVAQACWELTILLSQPPEC